MALNAIIMAGGEGSRLRPLTCGMPKPMVPILGRPVLGYALQLLKRHGLGEVGITLQYLPEHITRHFGAGNRDGVRLHYCREKEPLGTAGGVLKAASGRHAPTGTFVILSGDGLTDCNLSQAIGFHREKGALATLVLTRVRDPLSYGVVITDESGRVRRFVEKPGWGEAYANTVNTGIYILEPEVLSYIWPDKPCDFGRDLFPQLVRDNKDVFAFVSDAYWCDVGDQEAYVRAQADFLQGRVNLDPGLLIAETAQIDDTARIDGPLYLGAGARIGPHARISDCVVVGMNASIGAHSRVAHSILWDDAVIQNHAQLRGVVICRGAQMGAGAAALEGCALGDGAVLGARASLESGAKVWPGKRIDPCMRVTENLVWEGAARPSLSAGAVETRDPFTAHLLASAWVETCEAGPILIAHDGSPEAQATYATALGALCCQGAHAVALSWAMLPVFRNAQRGLGIPAGLYVHGNKIELTAQQGCMPPKALQRKVETLFARQDFSRPFSRTVAAPQTVSDADALYVGMIAASVPHGAFHKIRPHIAVFVKNPAHGPLVSRVLRVTGVQGRVATGIPHVEPWETGFILSATAESAMAFDSQDIPDAVRQTLLAYDSLGPDCGEWIAQIDDTAGLETLAATRGRVVRRVSSSMENWAGSLLTADARQFDLHFDGLYRILRITALLAMRSTTLRGLLADLPAVYRHAERVACPLPARGHLLRVIAESEKIAELHGGLRVTREDGFLTVNPDEREAEMVVVGEAASMEVARELCGELLDTIKKQIEGR